MIEHQLAEYLWADEEITNRVEHRIYPGHAPVGVLGELIVIREINRNPEYTIDLEAGIHDLIVQVDCYAAGPKSAYNLAELVRLRLSGYRGTIGREDPANIESARIINARQVQERPADNSDKWTHRYQMDFAMFVHTTIPTFT